MAILGFDISSRKVGYAFLVDESKVPLKKHYGTIELGSKLNLSEKLVLFRDKAQKLIEKFKPDVVVVEDVYIRHLSSAIILSRFSGVFIELCKRITNKEAILILTTRARAALELKNSKEEAFKFVVEKFGFKNWKFETHNDISDAFIVCLAFLRGVDGRASRKVARAKKEKGGSGEKTSEPKDSVNCKEKEQDGEQKKKRVRKNKGPSTE